jgi:hypothetical protein
VYGGTRTRRFEEFGAWQRTKSEAKLNINWKIGRRLGVKGYGSRIQERQSTVTAGTIFETVWANSILIFWRLLGSLTKACWLL